ncbi:hypothetical protein GALMADRAFT_136251 [Galerina marginata CBS 339.88]|uniref:CBM1 domain-containing protein n=1 Tax=Galerina marginata (strain CBS 339.88) TaxID=685588 RepID=A0A067TDH5_GALM3|nr:hypothetical protein GALMADRAFT_136251 [Galerina marginata CBS 339.88]
MFKLRTFIITIVINSGIALALGDSPTITTPPPVSFTTPWYDPGTTVPVTTLTPSHYGQCGGLGFTGLTVIGSGSALLLGDSPTITTPPPVTATTPWYDPGTTVPLSTSVSQHYNQCGGLGFTGPIVCAVPYTCTYYNQYVSRFEDSASKCSATYSIRPQFSQCL